MFDLNLRKPGSKLDMYTQKKDSKEISFSPTPITRHKRNSNFVSLSNAIIEQTEKALKARKGSQLSSGSNEEMH